MAKHIGLGKGLDALIPGGFQPVSTSPNEPGSDLSGFINIPIEKIIIITGKNLIRSTGSVNVNMSIIKGIPHVNRNNCQCLSFKSIFIYLSLIVYR